MAARPKKKKLLIILVILLSLAPEIGVTLAETYKAVDSADEDHNNWSTEMDDLADKIEAVHTDVIENELTGLEKTAHGESLQDKLDLL